MYERGPSGNITGYVPTALPAVQPAVQQPLNPMPAPSMPAPQPCVMPVQPPAPYVSPQQEDAAPQPPEGGNRFAAFFRRRSTLLLISALLCTLYLIFCHQTMGGILEATDVGDTMEELGKALGTALGIALLILFLWVSFIGQVFNWFAWGFNRRGLALTGAILYSVALLLGFSWGLGLIPSVIMSYTGYARLRRRQLAASR